MCDGACGNSRNHLETDACFMFPVTGFRLTNVIFQNIIIFLLLLKKFFICKTINYLHYLQCSYYTTDITITLLKAILTLLTLHFLRRIRYNT